jgi:hypothetical protein
MACRRRTGSLATAYGLCNIVRNLNAVRNFRHQQSHDVYVHFVSRLRRRKGMEHAYIVGEETEPAVPSNVPAVPGPFGHFSMQLHHEAQAAPIIDND